MRGILALFFFVIGISAPNPVWAKTPADQEQAVTATAATDPFRVTAIDWQIVTAAAESASWQALAERLFLCEVGALCDSQQLRDSLAILEASHRFQAIHLDATEVTTVTGEVALALTLRLTPAVMIRDIVISWAYPLLEREVLNVMTLYPGDILIESELAAEEERILALLKREGFVAPQVQVSAHPMADSSDYQLAVLVTPGPYEQLARLKMLGNDYYSTLRLKSRMQIWTTSFLPASSGRFIPTELDADIKKLVQFYRQARFAEVAIEPVIDRSAANHQLEVTLKIQEGARYTVDFIGNEAFWDMTLAKAITLFKQGNKNDLGLISSQKKITTLYQQAGYPKVVVTLEKEPPSAGERSIRFVIEEGPFTPVQAVEIRGQAAMDETEILAQVLTAPPPFWATWLGLDDGFSPTVLAEDLDNILGFYQQAGYLAAQVEKQAITSPVAGEAGVKVIIEVEEGIQTRVGKVTVLGHQGVSEAAVQEVIQLETGMPFNEQQLKADKRALAALISEQGYPYVAVMTRSQFSEDRRTVDLTYQLNLDQAVQVGQVSYSGHFRTQESVLAQAVKLVPGEPFSLKKMLAGQRDLRNLAIFNSVAFKPLGLKEKSQVINYFVEVEEKKPYFVEAALGYDTERGSYLQTKLGDNNLWGLNKSLWGGIELSELGYRLDLGGREPRLFGWDLALSTNLLAEKREERNQDFGTYTYGAGLGFNKKWGKQLSSGAGFRLERRDQYVLDNRIISLAEAAELTPRTILTGSASLSYDSRDSFIRPRKGLFSALSLEASQGLESGLDDFFKYEFELRYYVTPWSRLTLAGVGRAGYIDPLHAGGTIPDDQLFFLGGTTDIRGFSENLLRFDDEEKPLGGKMALSASLEARIEVMKKVELVWFYDLGRVSETVAEMDQTATFRATTGLGIRYLTPIGPVGLLYGAKLDRQAGEAAGRLHFSIGYTF